jgi:hypothetical protein
MKGGKQVSAFRKVLAAVAMLAIIIGSVLVGLLASGALSGGDAALPRAPVDGARPLAGAITFSVVLAFLSVVALLAGAVLYAVSVATCLFFFDFSRPVWSRFKGRMFIANILVPLPIMIGASGLVAAIGLPFLGAAGVASETALLLLLLAPFILLQFVSIWLSIWTPAVKRLAHSRLRAIGVEPARIGKGILLGISDPAKKSSRKLGWIEDDIGLLWITPNELIYEGDTDAFRVHRDQCLSIERVADAGSVSAYFGNVHIILSFAGEGSTPRRVRLHPESSMTATGTARASDSLAKKLEAWKNASPDVTAKA